MVNQFKVKPIYFMHQEKILNIERDAILDGIQEMLFLANMPNIPVINVGVFRTNGMFQDDGSLSPYMSVDWYIEEARRTSTTNQLNADTLQQLLINEPWRHPTQGGKDHYDVFAVHEDITLPGNNYLIGLATRNIGTSLSTYRFNSLDPRSAYECIKTETMHELGHVFGLIPDKRKNNVEYSIGKHCLNRCIMRQGLTVPHDWIVLTNDRLKGHSLCPTCHHDLQEYFFR
jgi:predicted Zn-dependent protease